MAIDFNKPDGTETSKVTFRTYIVDNNKASLQMLHTTGDNIPTNTIRRGVVTGSIYKWQNYNGSTWDDLTFRGSFDEIDVTGTNTARATFKNSGVGASYAYFKNSDTTNGTYIGINASEETVFHNQENTAMHFGTNDTNRMTLSAAGDLSILGGGLNITDSVAEKLTLNQSDSAACHMNFKNSVATTGFLVGLDASEVAEFKNQENTAMNFYTNNTLRATIGAAGHLILASGNSLGIGISPTDMLHIEGSSPALKIVASNDTGLAEIKMYSDRADDNADGWSLRADNDHSFSIMSYSSGSFVDYFTVTSGNDVIIPTGQLGVVTGSSIPAMNTNADDFILGDGTSVRGMTIYSSNSTTGNINFADTDANSQGRIEYNHSTDKLRLSAGAAYKLSFGTYIEPNVDFLTDRWTTASDTNTIIGRGAAGSGNLAHSSGSQGWYNTFFGYLTGEDISTGHSITCMGSSAGKNVTTCTDSTFIGANSGTAVTTELYCTFVGAGSGTYCEASYNLGVGTNACRGGTGGMSGVGNIGIGKDTGFQITTGSYCIFIGNGGASTSHVGYNNTTGDHNICIGYASGNDLVDGVGNTFVGGNTGTSYASYDYCTCLGYGSDTLTGNNQMLFGNSNTVLYAYNTTINARSDIRDKADVVDTDLGLDFILKLRPTKHKWDIRDDYKIAYERKHKGKLNYEKKGLNDFKPDGTLKKKRFHQSFIAQEVKAVMDELNVDFAGYQDHAINGGEDVLSLCYGQFIPPMVRATQELNTLITKNVESAFSAIGENTENIAKLRKEIDELKIEITNLKSI
jgi:hypothetical protein